MRNLSRLESEFVRALAHVRVCILISVSIYKPEHKRFLGLASTYFIDFFLIGSNSGVVFSV